MQELPQGWFYDGDINLYRALVEQIPDYGTMIELGVWKGRSLCSVADLIKKKNITVYAIDTFKGTLGEVHPQGSKEEHKEALKGDLEKEFKKNIKNFGLEVKILNIHTNEASKKLNIMFDLIFIDADHSYEAIKQDLKNWLPKCKGIIAGHDYELESIKKAVNEIFPNVKYLHCTRDPGRGTMWYYNVKEKGYMNNKKIDIIIPAFKAQNTIERTLASIVMQSIVNNLTVTIVNDADSIGYKKFVNQFSEYIDIKEIILDKNEGPGVARQKGIDATNSPYFTCIDADDTFAGAFALEILLKGAEANPNHHTIVGSFVEQHPDLQFINHSSDLVWMFGKLYTRAFINKYNIRFNKTRANEDNGFNTTIRLVSSETEKILFLPDIVYYWHYKEDSITRKDNAQYSYDQSYCGYTDNMIDAIKNARKVKPFNSYIDMWAIQVMCQLYIYYYQTIKRDIRFKNQNYKYCIKYYNEIFKGLQDRIPKENLDAIFGETISQQAPNMKDIVPDKTIFQFIEGLGHEQI